jgi:hypothetical protein
VDEPPVDDVAWLERLLAAADAAIARVHELNDPAYAALLDDLQQFRDRMAEDLGR